MLEK
ncbi:hypothetical protein DN30_2807 [Vibrio cholerae]|jgi:hypothetical protein